MKKNNYSILALFMSFLSITSTSLSMEFKTSNNQVSTDFLEEVLIKLSNPITVPSAGISDFLKHVYNNPHYLEFLPNNFSHLMQFLYQGKQLGQKRIYTQQVLRIFMNKIKAGSYVNAYAFDNLLEAMPALLENNFKFDEELCEEALQSSISDLLYQEFLYKFTNFKADPKSFLDRLSHDIIEVVHTKNVKKDDSLHIEELRKTLLIFLEISIQKLIWNPENHEESWESVKSIAQNLTNLFESNILTDLDDLNDLFRSLLERYCFFIDITALELPNTFFDSVNKDIHTNYLPVLEIQDLEQEIETKKNRLIRALNEGKEKKK